MTNLEIKKHGIFDKSRKEKPIAYQTIGGSRSSVDSCSVLAVQEKQKSMEENLNLNAAVNLKKSKTFKIIVNKKGKEKEKITAKKDKNKGKSKKRKRKESVLQDSVLESDKQREYTQHFFGVSLSEACKYSKSHDGYPLPAFFRSCIDYLETDNRLSFEGIYRIPGVNSQIAKLKQVLNTEIDIVDILKDFDIAVVTSIVKSFLRDLKPEIISRPLESLLFKSLEKHKDNIHEKIAVVKALIQEQLPEENKYLIALVINHMDKVVDMSHQNKMTLENVLIVLSPALHLHFELLKFFYDHSSALFMEYQVPTYVPPIKPGPEHEEELPETVEGINEELKKQISYLDDLHEQINQGLGTKKIEYLIWEVQLIVTNLKRKKYIAELNDPELIKNELKKYERQLKRLHKGMLDTSVGTMTSNPISTVANNVNQEPVTIGAPSSVDQELWQVQRTITTLNRKLKVLTTSYRVSTIFDNTPQIAVSHKADNVNDDDDDDSVQLNLTLRKIPIDSIEIVENEENNERVNDINSDENSDFPQNNIVEEEKACYIAVEDELPSKIEKTAKWLQSETSLNTATSSEKSVENINVEENCTHLFPADNNSTSSNGAVNTTVTEEYPGSNSESQLTGSNMATNIEDLMQTGEIWTNEKEELLPEDEDLRNEALRSLFMREELTSIRNDLKTRIASESNEILRLKRNIEDLDDKRTQKNFRAQNQYRKLNETSSSTEEGHSLNFDKEEDDNNNSNNNNETSEEDDCELESSCGESESLQQHSEKTVGAVAEDLHDDDTAELVCQHREICEDNERLEKENMDLLEQIEQERSHCVDLKVALRTHMLLTCTSPWPSNIDE